MTYDDWLLTLKNLCLPEGDVDAVWNAWKLNGAADFINREGRHDKSELFPDFQTGFCEHQPDIDMDDTITENFHCHLKEVIDFALHNADVVVGTPVALGSYAMYSQFKPEVAFINEATKMMEADLWGVFGIFNPNASIFTGDHRQLTPTDKDHKHQLDPILKLKSQWNLTAFNHQTYNVNNILAMLDVNSTHEKDDSMN
ncbi:hypothetical protein FQN53_003404 [Emmonsiellopsis sp. PD_33]|nr:hypothetical protein FQN53_003404 [Emmonsiellopsis sp. PD_33]